jgi:ankyrin repeat protein
MTPTEQASLDHRLIDAADRGDTRAVQTLLAAGANVHAQDDRALRWAAHDGHAEIVQTLLAAGADVHVGDDLALRWAAMNGHTDTVKLLLAHGADVHGSDDRALRRAVDSGHTETIRVLAKHIFAPEVRRGKSRAEIEAHATALYAKIKAESPQPDRLRTAGTILADCALDCWFQVRPPPPKLTISPIPAQPRPL